MKAYKSKYHKLLRREQIRGILEQSPTNILANVVVAALAFWGFHSSESNNSTYQNIWFAFILFISLFQAIEVIRIKRKTLDSKKGTELLYGSVFIALIIGISWAIFLNLFISYDDQTIYLLAALVCGMLAGALVSTSIYFSLYLLFSLPFILTFVYLLLGLETRNYLILALLMIVFYLMCLNMAYILNKRVLESFYLRFENVDVLKELKAQKKIAENANIAKSKFLAATSHDLRQPLHALGFFIDALKSSPKKSRELFEKIDASIASLKDLFDALLDISKLDSGVISVAYQHFKSKKLVSNLENEYLLSARNKGLILIIENDMSVLYSDHDLLKRLIGNLISNAIRYTDTGEVKIILRQLNEKQISITVSDTGIGINSEELEHIFDEFYQIKNPERDRNNGLGLGLAIVKKLATLLDIPINVNSKISEGTQFELLIPIGVESKIVAEEKVVSYQNRELEGKNILVIDDEIEVLNAMKLSLTSWGCNVLICESKASAIEKITALNFDIDLIISDLRLRNNETGIDAINSVFKAIKKEVPALLVTGDTSPNCIANASKSGFKLLHKPLKPAQLRLQIINLLK